MSGPAPTANVSALLDVGLGFLPSPGNSQESMVTQQRHNQKVSKGAADLGEHFTHLDTKGFLRGSENTLTPHPDKVRR